MLVCDNCGRTDTIIKKGVRNHTQRYKCTVCGCYRVTYYSDDDVDIVKENVTLAKQKQKLQDKQRIERKSFRKIPGQDLDKVQVDERGEYAVNIHNRQDTIRPADGKNFKPFIQGKQSGKMESGYLSDDDYTIKDGKISPANQVSEAEKRRRERAENESGETQFFYNRKPKPANEEKVYNMTPDATPEESKAVRDKFDATYLKGRGPFTKKKEGKKDACYHKVKSRVKVWPSAYASGQLVQCRKAGAANWGEKSKKK